MKPIRVACSGSGFRFPVHCGAFQAIADAGYTPIEYVGSSGGAIVSSLAAFGMPLSDMETLTLQHDWSPMLTFNPFTLLRHKAYCSGDYLLNWLLDITDYTTFADLTCELKILACDILTESIFIFSKETTPHVPIAFAARCSASIPFVFAPVPFHDSNGTSRLFCDAGVMDNMPVDFLTPNGTLEVPHLAVMLTSKVRASKSLDPGLFSIITRILNMLMAGAERTEVNTFRRIARFAFVESGYANSLDKNIPFHIRQRLLTDGYSTVSQVLCTK